MPRKRVVSRTIKVTHVEFMAVDKVDEKIVNDEIAVAGVFKSSKALANAVQKHLPEHLQFVKVKKFWETSDRYWLPEEKFIELANVSPIEEEN